MICVANGLELDLVYSYTNQNNYPQLRRGLPATTLSGKCIKQMLYPSMMAAVVSSVIIHIRVGIFLSVLVHKKTLLILIDIPCADVLFFPGFFFFFQ